MLALLGGATSACSLVLDSKSTQCSVDADCSSFNGFPTCVEGVCSASGLGPPGCISGTPKKQEDYLNACTTSKFSQYDNCTELNYGCGGVSPPLPGTTMAMVGKSPAATNPPDPSGLCTDGAPSQVVAGVTTYNMIYMYGSSDFGPLLRAAQPSLSALATPYRAVFQAKSSCEGVTNVFTKKNIIDPNPGAGGWAFYYNANGDAVNCRLEPQQGNGVQTDIGVSDLYAQTCNAQLVPGTTVGDYTGPVVPFVFAVKSQSEKESISAEAAHLVFGNGGHAPQGSGMNDTTPWTDYTKFFIRSSTAGSTVLTSLVIGINAGAFWGIDRLTTDNLRDGLLAASDTTSAGSIGILSIDFYDKNRGNLKALYLQAMKQKYGYLPDSSASSIDKQNVRDGHYALWGYVHLFTALNGQGLPSPAANAMVLLFNVPKLDQGLVDDIIGASLTPQCAMTVKRTTEIGDFSPQTGFSCGCYFDFKTKGRTSCKVCNTSDDCSGDPSHSFCNYGYCDTTQ